MCNIHGLIRLPGVQQAVQYLHIKAKSEYSTLYFSLVCFCILPFKPDVCHIRGFPFYMCSLSLFISSNTECSSLLLPEDVGFNSNSAWVSLTSILFLRFFFLPFCLYLIVDGRKQGERERGTASGKRHDVNRVSSLFSSTIWAKSPFPIFLLGLCIYISFCFFAWQIPLACFI